jgi:hypothetical protein
MKFARINFTIGIIELSGVLSSWAIDEKNMALTFFDVCSSSLILVISLQIAMT